MDVWESKVTRIARVLLFAVVFSARVQAQETSRWTFDGTIHNNSLAISPDERTAVVSYSERPDVIVYDLESKKARGVLNGFVTPRNILFEPTGRFFYISDSSLGLVEKVDASSLKTLENIAAGAGAFGTTISKDGLTLYVNNEAASTVTVYDLPSGRPVAVIPGFAQPRQGVRLSPDGSVLYVTNFLGDKIVMVDVATRKINGEIKGFNKIRAISITRDGKTLFAGNSGTNSVAVVDIPSRAIIKQIPVGHDPYGAALSPDERFVYSGNLADNSLSAIALPSLKVVGTVTGFNEPRQAIVDRSEQAQWPEQVRSHAIAVRQRLAESEEPAQRRDDGRMVKRVGRRAEGDPGRRRPDVPPRGEPHCRRVAAHVVRRLPNDCGRGCARRRG